MPACFFMDLAALSVKVSHYYDLLSLKESFLTSESIELSIKLKRFLSYSDRVKYQDQALIIVVLTELCTKIKRFLIYSDRVKYQDQALIIFILTELCTSLTYLPYIKQLKLTELCTKIKLSSFSFSPSYVPA